MADKSRAEYYRKRRETRKQFMVLMDKLNRPQFHHKLQHLGKIRAEWLRYKVHDQLVKKQTTAHIRPPKTCERSPHQTARA